MRVVDRFDVRKLRNSEWQEFSMRVTTALVNAFGAEGNKASKAFIEAQEAYSEAILQVPETASLQHADEKTDKLWCGMKYTIKAGEYGPDEERIAANEIVKTIFEMTPNPTSLPYHKEYGQIFILLGRLESLSDDVLEAACMKKWVVALRNAYSDWQREVDQATELQTKPKGIVIQARRALEEAWRDLCHRIEAKVDDEDPAAITVMDKLNVLTAKIRRALKKRKPANEANPAETPDIDLDAELPAESEDAIASVDEEVLEE